MRKKGGDQVRYVVTEHVGEVMKEKEYEGTPQEIADLINRTNKIPRAEFPKIPKAEIPKIEFKIPEIDISKITDEMSKEMKRATRKIGIK